MINRGAAAYWIPAFAGMTPNVTRVRPTSSHCGRGRIASSDAIPVRGCGVSMDLDPSPQPSPTRGEGANHRCRQINFPPTALALTQGTGLRCEFVRRTATDIRQDRGYINDARHVRAFGVWIGIK